jgi:hypothetical protein
MGKKIQEGRQAEVEALKSIPGMNPDDIMRQISGEPKPPDTPPDNPPAGEPPAGTPKPGEAGPPPDATGILKEIFGDQFSSVDDLKNSNIPGKLKELDELRQRNQELTSKTTELEGKLNLKPKTNFANDDVALFNEFVKATGIKSFDVFNRLNSSDIANMDYMNAIILARQLENPELVLKEPQLRKHIEKTYNVDPEQVTADELEVNQIGLSQEGAKAKAKLQELKGKLKIPEPEPSAPVLPPKWTEEQKTQATDQWTKANKAMGDKLSKIPIYFPVPKDSKDLKEPPVPFINFAIPEETQKAVQKQALMFAINNQLEVEEKTLNTVAKFMYSDLVLNNLDQIAHSIFEKARSLSKEESLKYYHNPGKLGGENPPPPRGEVDKEEEVKKSIFDAEMKR